MFRNREPIVEVVKKVIKSRKIVDPRFGDESIGKLINKVMLDGKKSTAENIVYEALAIVEDRVGVKALEAFQTAVGNIKPNMEVKSRSL